MQLLSPQSLEIKLMINFLEIQIITMLAVNEQLHIKMHLYQDLLSHYLLCTVTDVFVICHTIITFSVVVVIKCSNSSCDDVYRIIINVGRQFYI